MKRNSILLLFIAFSLNLNAQDTITKGKRKELYDQNKNLRAVIEYEKDGERGYSNAYFSNGNLMAEGFYLGKKKDSVWKIYTESGNLLGEQHYKRGIKTGLWKIFNADGSIREEIRYENDMKNGLCREGLPDGGWSLCNYKDNLREGNCKEYLPTGELQKEGRYINGHRDGIWKFYDANGSSVIAQEIYANDVSVDYEIALSLADGEKFMSINAIAFFYPKGKQTIVVLNEGEMLNVMRDFQSLLVAINGKRFIRLNEKLNFYAAIQSIKGIEPTEDGNYYIIIEPNPQIKVVTDENSKRAMELLFLPQEF